MRVPAQKTTAEDMYESDDQVDGVLFNTGPSTPLLNGSAQPTTHLYGAVTEAGPTVGVGSTGVQSTDVGAISVESIKVYKRRFWILGIFSFMAMFQDMMWNTWGPLSASIGAAYPGWSSGTVAMMSNWGTIMFVVCIAPMCWLMNTKGLRVGVLTCAALIATGTVLRVLPLMLSAGSTWFTVMCHLCAVLVGIAGTLVMAAPPLIAAVWFPPQERTTATAFAQMFNALGNSGSYMEPLLVREPPSQLTPQDQENIRGDISRLMYIWAAVGVGLMVVLVVYFPSSPPSPPSRTSHVQRFNFRESVISMVRNKDLLLVTLCYGLCLGVPSAWSSVLNYSLYDLGMTQDEAMLVGQASVLASCVGTLVMGRCTDLFYGHIKLSLLVCLIANIIFSYWFFLLSWGAVPVTSWQIYTSVVGCYTFTFAMAPLCFELAVELAYPCSEVVVAGLLTGVNNFVGLCFLFIFLLPLQSYLWVTYVLLVTLSMALVPLPIIKEDYARSTLDRMHEQTHEHSRSHSPYQPI